MAIFEGKKSYFTKYFQNERLYSIDSRDSYEKVVQFFDDGKFYRFASSIENSETLKDLPEKTVRGFTVYDCTTVERMDDERILCTQIYQFDMRIRVPASIIEKGLPTQQKNWYNNIMKYYKDNYKKI